MLRRDRERVLLGLRLLEESVQKPAMEAAKDGVWIPVSGASMHPWIPDGSEVRIVRPSGRFGLGDVVVVALEGEIVVHRVVGRKGPLLRTKGDSSHLPDPPPWSPVDVLGFAIAVRCGGRTLRLTSPLARILSWAIALHSGLLGAAASLVPRDLFASRELGPRAFRFGLRLANRFVPYLALLPLLPMRDADPRPVPPPPLADPSKEG